MKLVWMGSWAVWAALITLGAVIVLTTGCSHYTATFEDEGTTFKTELWLAPFSKLDAQDAKMAYDITNFEDGTQDIGIRVGASLDGLDQTKQVEALGIFEDIIMDAVMGYLGKAQIDATENIREKELELELDKLKLQLELEKARNPEPVPDPEEGVE